MTIRLRLNVHGQLHEQTLELDNEVDANALHNQRHALALRAFPNLGAIVYTHVDFPGAFTLEVVEAAAPDVAPAAPASTDDADAAPDVAPAAPASTDSGAGEPDADPAPSGEVAVDPDPTGEVPGTPEVVSNNP